jgi:hypothetical protein
MPADRDLLGRLRDGSDEGAVARLARLLVDDVLGTPVGELLDALRVADVLGEAVRAAASSDAAARHLVDRLEEARKELAEHRGPVGGLVPPALAEGARRLAQLPFSVRREAVLRVLDRPGFRQVVRAQLVQTLSEFGRKAASPVSDNALARGLGGLGKLAGQIAKPSPLGAIASAVSGEVERQVEKRANDFADSAVAGVVASIADQASDPGRAAQQAELRVEILEGVLALTGPDLSEVAKGTLDTGFEGDVKAALARIVGGEGARPLGEVLADLGLREAVEKHAARVLRARLAHVVAGDAFAAWLADLVKV